MASENASVLIFEAEPVVGSGHGKAFVSAIPSATIWRKLLQQLAVAVEYINFGFRKEFRTDYIPEIIASIIVRGKEFLIPKGYDFARNGST